MVLPVVQESMVLPLVEIVQVVLPVVQESMVQVPLQLVQRSYPILGILPIGPQIQELHGQELHGQERPVVLLDQCVIYKAADDIVKKLK